MTLQQYRFLSDEAQQLYLRHKAVIIATIHDDEGVCTLFQVDSFYLEVVGNGLDITISSINYFEETEFLEPYLQAIDITPVYRILNA